jgi:hypothetical protein
MTNKYISMALVSTLVGSAISSAEDQYYQDYLPDYIEVSPRNVTFALTAKYSAPGLTVKDPDTGKNVPVYETESETVDKNGNVTKVTSKLSAVAKTFKYGNTEIIKALVADGTLEGPPSGWALVLQSPTDSQVEEEYNDPDYGPKLVARKKIDGEFVEIDLPYGIDYSGVAPLTEKADYNHTYSYKLVDGEYVETSSVATFTGSGTDEGTSKITLPITNVALGEEPIQVQLTGAHTESGKEMTFYPRFFDYDFEKIVTDKSVIGSEWIPGAGSVKGVTGSAYFGAYGSEEFGTYQSICVFGGTINIGAATGKLILAPDQPY